VPELRLRCLAERDKNAKVRVGDVAARQFGRIATAQLLAVDVGRARISRWAGANYLYPVLPRVFAVGHPGTSDEADLFAAVLYAGPGAALNGLCAGLWRGLVKWRTAEAIEVATPRHCRSLAADDPSNGLGRPIVVRDRREFRRAMYHGIPTVPIPLIVLDLAATGDLELVRFALANMDFMRILNERALKRVCGRGVPGSAVLREALGRQQPLLARCRSPGEIKLVRAFEVTGVPMPEINVKVAGITVDAFWRDRLVIVEVDGEGNHGTWRQRKLNLADELTLRKAGCLVIRYSDDLLDDPWEVHADLMPQLEERRGRAARCR
jgi:hypothetical protein